jgi:hypothetical protein
VVKAAAEAAVVDLVVDLAAEAARVDAGSGY